MPRIHLFTEQTGAGANVRLPQCQLQDDSPHRSHSSHATCADAEPAAAKAVQSCRPEKRKEADDVEMIVADIAGPSKRPRGSAQQHVEVYGDIAVISDHTSNPNRDLPHRREVCATNKFLQVASRDNSIYCEKVRPAVVPSLFWFMQAAPSLYRLKQPVILQ